MIPFKNRLVRRKDFAQVYRRGSLFSFENIALKVIKNNLDESRIGIAVGLGYSKRAVARNQIKRQLREILRVRLKEIKKGLDIVFMVRGAKEKESKGEELRRVVEKALKKGNLINN